MRSKNRLVLGSGEETIVATRAHPVRLVGPAVIAWGTVLMYSALHRLLDLIWRPSEAPWTTLHSLVGWLITLAALWVAYRYVLLPAWRWLRTVFVLTNQRLALTGPPAKDGVVALPLGALRSARVVAPTGVFAMLTRGVDRGTVIADFGALGGLKLAACPQPDAMVDLVQQSGRRAGNYSSSGTSTSPRSSFQGGPRG
ncbi:hypothetical protein IEE91_08710 [Kocuria sp. cx-455]|uniref:hypothetical protein n=1 Tax=Kocuria sp. cx-455 TaxID=2771377 RepID=UPI0016866748|nr:hypothetical protein [Kocuria sp. cx-455]MBD2765261.1 hypothetical protein [Kocuria sp. cx-455]